MRYPPAMIRPRLRSLVRSFAMLGALSVALTVLSATDAHGQISAPGAPAPQPVKGGARPGLGKPATMTTLTLTPAEEAAVSKALASGKAAYDKDKDKNKLVAAGNALGSRNAQRAFRARVMTQVDPKAGPSVKGPTGDAQPLYRITSATLTGFTLAPIPGYCQYTFVLDTVIKNAGNARPPEAPKLESWWSVWAWTSSVPVPQIGAGQSAPATVTVLFNHPRHGTTQCEVETPTDDVGHLLFNGVGGQKYFVSIENGTFFLIAAD